MAAACEKPEFTHDGRMTIPCTILTVFLQTKENKLKRHQTKNSNKKLNKIAKTEKERKLKNNQKLI